MNKDNDLKRVIFELIQQHPELEETFVKLFSLPRDRLGEVIMRINAILLGDDND